jgi:hypothetical protein
MFTRSQIWRGIGRMQKKSEPRQQYADDDDEHDDDDDESFIDLILLVRLCLLSKII